MSLNQVKVGCAEKIIDVPLFAELAGYGPFLGRRNLGVRDPIYCRALTFDDGHHKNIIIVSDVMASNDRECRAMRGSLGESYGLEPGGILFVATHTHSAPLTGPSDIGYGEVCPEFVENWRKTVSAVVGEALSNEEEVRAFAGRAPVRKPLGQNRADPEHGHTDPAIRWVKFVRGNGTVKVLLHNHAMHGVVFGRQRLVSADWMGDANRKIRERGLAEIPFFLYGCSGDINVIWTHPKAEERDKNLDWISESYANDLENDLSHGHEIVLSPVDSVLETVEFPTEPVIAEELRGTAAKLLAKLPSEHGILLQYIHDRMIEMAVMAERGHDFRAVHDLQVLRMGDLAVCAIPGEPFLAVGESVMKEAPFKFPLAVSVANGDAGYFPTPEMFKQYPDPFCCDDFGAFGFYEVWFGPGLHRPKFKPGIVDFITKKLLSLSEKIKKAR